MMPEFTAEGVGEPLVALFFALVRNIPDTRLESLMSSCLESISSASSDGQRAKLESNRIADVFVMMFQTRDCRGGKGERLLSYKMLLQLFDEFPVTTMRLIEFFPEYGYYKDFLLLAELMGSDEKYTMLRSRILDIVANQLIADEAALSRGDHAAVSLCAKYAPREHSHFAKKTNVEGAEADQNKSLFKELVNKLYPKEQHHNNKELYRKLVSKLTAALDVPEVKMCGKRYSELNYEKVPSVCLKKFSKAFFNEKLKESSPDDLMGIGNRFPDDEDRILSRQNLMEAMKKDKVKGKQLYPHELVTAVNAKNCSSVERVLFHHQWKSMRSGLLDSIAKKKAELDSKATSSGSTPARGSVDIGKLVPLSDVSGSMAGIPMEVSIALGILVSEINHPAFRNRVLTFTSQPAWVMLEENDSFYEKVRKMRASPWGGTTDFQKAALKICKIVVENRLPIEEVPDLIVFSDMQFDEASKNFSTQYELMQEMFRDAGMQICGQPYPAPRIIFWNLRGDTNGFPAQADTENVQLLSGFSPSLLKQVLEGDAGEPEAAAPENAEVELDEKGELPTTKKKTPYETLRSVLDDTRYDKIRGVLSASNEGRLGLYSFEPPLPPPPSAALSSN